MIETTREGRLQWMAVWAAKHGLQLELEGEVGFGRECVGITADGKFPDYEWHDDQTYARMDKNGDVWTPPDAYHKHPCVAVLGRGENAERQLHAWLQWFALNGFAVETGTLPLRPDVDPLMLVLLGKHRYARMVKAETRATA